jgi:hypothetical protein
MRRLAALLGSGALYAVAGLDNTPHEEAQKAKPPCGGFGPAAIGAYNPASAFSAATLSSASQVNSGSSRPKWP